MAVFRHAYDTKEIAPVADKDTCNSVLLYEDLLHCELPPDHVTPTESLPQGTPHESSEYIDVLTGEPWKWWG